MNDSLLALSYVETYDISYPEALRRIEDEVVEIRQSLENEGKFEIENIGMLFLNEDGNISFEPCEAGILTPDFYGLGGFDMLPIAQIDNGEQQNENQNVAMTVNLAKEEQPVKKRQKHLLLQPTIRYSSQKKRKKRKRLNSSASRRAGCAIWQQPASPSSPSSPSLLHSEVLLSRRARLTRGCLPASCLKRWLR